MSSPGPVISNLVIGRVVDPDPVPAGSEIICMFGSGSIIYILSDPVSDPDTSAVVFQHTVR